MLKIKVCRCKKKPWDSRISVVDDLLDVGDDFGDVLGHSGQDIGRQDTARRHVVVELLLKAARQLLEDGVVGDRAAVLPIQRVGEEVAGIHQQALETKEKDPIIIIIGIVLMYFFTLIFLCKLDNDACLGFHSPYSLYLFHTHLVIWVFLYP